MNKPEKKSIKKPLDRRVQKTKKLLSDALVALILEKGYDAVSTQDIIDKANVGRSTFYLHYENKEQLFLWGHDHLKNLILGNGETQIQFSDFYHHLTENHALALSVLSRNTGRNSNQLALQSLTDIFQKNILVLYPTASISKAEIVMHLILASAGAAALVQLITEWLKQGLPYSADRMATESVSLIEKIFSRRPLSNPTA